MRLTTRKIDAFTPAERDLLLKFAEHRSIWFTPDALSAAVGTALRRREVLNALQRLGHVFPTYHGRPPGASQGTLGYRLTDHGRAAIAEMEKREAA